MSETTDEVKTGLIHKAMVGMLRDVEPIAKDQRNEQQKYNFRGIDAVYNELHPLLCKHGIYSTSTIIKATHNTTQSEKRQTIYHSILEMRYTYWAEDGSNVSTEVIGEGIDYGGDKASNKAMSVADKYALLQLLKIPTAMIDPDRTEHLNPEADATAPRQNPRAERVTSDEVRVITAQWKELNPGKDKTHWFAFVGTATGRDFNPSKPEQWTRTDLDSVKERLAIQMESDLPVM